MKRWTNWKAKISNLGLNPSDSPPDYDVGAVEAEDLLVEEETESDHSLLNIIEHESVEEMGDHLESVTILGDLPEEVEL